MHQPVTETSNIKGVENILSDIARRIYARQLIGKVLIITDNPIATEGIVRKFWLRIMRQHQKQRSQTQHAVLISDLTNTITAMQQLQFTARDPFEAPGADVFVIQPYVLKDLLPICTTIFVLAAVKDADICRLEASLPHNGLLIKYTP